jgi:hypothetical protein
VEPGALCGLSQLSTLQELRLGDVDGNNPDDVDTICNMVTRLTSLHMVGCVDSGVCRDSSTWHLAGAGKHAAIAAAAAGRLCCTSSCCSKCRWSCIMLALRSKTGDIAHN